MAMAGITAQLARPVKQASPMTTELLEEIYHRVNFNNQFQHACYAATLSGFYLIIRASNLVPISRKQFNPQEQLTRWHVGLDQELKLAIFIIEWSKNNQNQKKEMKVPVSPCENEKICLIKTLHRYFQQVPAQQHHPCFCYHDKTGKVKPITYAQLNQQIKTLVDKTGRDGSIYTSHCLRRGGIGHAVHSGLDPQFLRIIGDWASTCFLRYIDFELDLRLAASRQFSRNSKF